MKIKRALLSVSNKDGLVEFARFLSENGVELISTGGTMKTLKDAGIPVTYVSEVTGFPEIMDGRVKTLNPYIHGGILAVRDNENHIQDMLDNNIKPIDMVVVNLYPFKETIAKEGVTEEDAIENIDIGGPAMIRAAAKNFKYVAVVVNPSSYERVMDDIKNNDCVTDDTRKKLAQEAFSHTSQYDAAIFEYLLKTIEKEEYPSEKAVFLEKVQSLRYGENPHQSATFYKDVNADSGIAFLKQLHGKELSFNNIVDVEAAYRIVSEFSEPAATIIKHTNPCGSAIGKTIDEAYERAFKADEVSAFGGIIALNKEVDEVTANKISTLFAEAVIAPEFSSKALAILTSKKNLRLIKLPIFDLKNEYDMKKVLGGMLVQKLDTAFAQRAEMKVVTKKAPTDKEWEELIFAMKIVKHVKSNAIVLVKDFATIGIGAGQMNRVGSADIAIKQAGDNIKGAVLASDAFFPFGDTVALATKAGVTAIIQPGGSVKDEESIIEADKHGIAMVFSGMRHFKH